jgi:hypothetical protein
MGNSAAFNADLFGTDGAISMGSRRDLDAVDIPFGAVSPGAERVNTRRRALDQLRGWAAASAPDGGRATRARSRPAP